MENVRKRVNLEIIPQIEIAQITKRQSKLSFKGISQHYKDFSVYKYDKEKTVFDKPIYLGFGVLELSKLLMYEFYCHKRQQYYNNTQSASGKIKLQYMDTGSFIISLKTTNLLIDLKYFKDDFDFSELDESQHIYDTINKKVVGKMKIETSPIIEFDNFVTLRSKPYAILSQTCKALSVKKILNPKKILPRRKVIVIHYLNLKQQLQLNILCVQMLTI